MKTLFRYILPILFIIPLLACEADQGEQLVRKANDGHVGIIKTVPGEVKACRYCPVVGICTQAETMLADGRLTL